MARKLPAIVCKLTYVHDAWIVGSLADPQVDVKVVRDIDVIVPFRNWQQAAQLIPESAEPNSFGGWKFTSEGKTIDVWPGDLDWLMVNFACKSVWHPRTNTLFERVE
jgi:hypothetical protein